MSGGEVSRGGSVRFPKKDIVSIEKVQRRFTKRLPGLKNFTYQERLNRLKLVSLEQRRLYMELIMFLK